MKKVILIVFIFLSYNIYSIDNNKIDKSNFEVGVAVGLVTGSGVSLRFTLINDFSIKLSGFVINSKFQDDISYEARISMLYSLYENKIFELYFINSVFKTNIIIIKPKTDERLIGFAPGFGFKLKIKEALPSYIKPQNNNNVSLFVELQENVTNLGINVRNIRLEPNVNLGILFNF